jgi:flagellar biosynthesis/type III secretory pathway protein FliH
LSSLLRGESVAVIDTRRMGSAAPRVFGSRVLRADHVGMERPIPLAVPVTHSGTAFNDPTVDELLEEVAPPPPDFSELAEAARVQGYEIGFEQGHAAGVAAAEAAMADSLHRLQALIAGVHESHSVFFRAAERQVVDLALQIAGKVVERELENMPDLAVNVIRSALEEMDARTAVRVRVNPDDAEVLQRRWLQVVPSGVPAERIELQPDERIAPGGGVIETTHGQVDAQLSSKIEQLGNALWTFVMESNSEGEA